MSIRNPDSAQQNYYKQAMPVADPNSEHRVPFDMNSKLCIVVEHDTNRIHVDIARRELNLPLVMTLHQMNSPSSKYDANENVLSRPLTIFLHMPCIGHDGDSVTFVRGHGDHLALYLGRQLHI